jgi:hypothetical protein
MSASSHRDQPRLDEPSGQVRDGMLMLVLGLVVATGLRGGGTPAPVGFAVATWGLALVAQALWVRYRRRT